jgi:hypothetical protein
MNEKILQGALTFLGFAISIIAVFYFAGVYLPDVSQWTRMASLILLGLFFAFMGVYLRGMEIGEPFFGDHLKWLRPTYVLYLCSVGSSISAEVVFLGIPQVPTPLKVLASLLIGVGLILFVSLGQKMRRDAEHGAD